MKHDPVSCTRKDGVAKRSWRKRQEAVLNARRTGNQARAYRCPSCGQYHVTTSPLRRPALDSL